jgi:hypothetical protein
MKKYLIIFVLSFFIITPVFALDTANQFAVSFCLKNDINQNISLHYIYDDEFYSYGLFGGYSTGIDHITPFIFGYNDETGQNIEISAPNITEEQLNSFSVFVVNYENQALNFYYNGALIGSDNINLDNLTLNYEYNYNLDNIANVQEYATTLTPTQISGLTCDQEIPVNFMALSATSTLELAGETIINTTLQFITLVLVQYFPYALILLILAGLTGAFSGFIFKVLKTKKDK